VGKPEPSAMPSAKRSGAGQVSGTPSG